MKIKTLSQDFSLWMTLFFQAIILGGTVYQMMVIVPEFCRDLPKGMADFAVSQVEPRTFWTSPLMGVLHLFSLLAIGLNWNTPRRKWLLLSIGFGLLGTFATLFYFIPRLQIMGIITDKASDDAALLARTVKEWIIADYIRFFATVIPAFFTCIKAVSLSGGSKE